MARFALLHPNTVPSSQSDAATVAAPGAASGGVHQNARRANHAIRGSEKSPIADGSNALSGPAHDTSTKTSQKASPPPASRPLRSSWKKNLLAGGLFGAEIGAAIGLGAGVTAAIKGATLGAAIGSVLPGVGTAVGAVVGALGGGILGATVGGALTGAVAGMAGYGLAKAAQGAPKAARYAACEIPLRLTHRSKADKATLARSRQVVTHMLSTLSEEEQSCNEAARILAAEIMTDDGTVDRDAAARFSRLLRGSQPQSGLAKLQVDYMIQTLSDLAGNEPLTKNMDGICTMIDAFTDPSLTDPAFTHRALQDAAGADSGLFARAHCELRGIIGGSGPCGDREARQAVLCSLVSASQRNDWLLVDLKLSDPSTAARYAQFPGSVRHWQKPILRRTQIPIASHPLFTQAVCDKLNDLGTPSFEDGVHESARKDFGRSTYIVDDCCVCSPGTAQRGGEMVRTFIDAVGDSDHAKTLSCFLHQGLFAADYTTVVDPTVDRRFKPVGIAVHPPDYEVTVPGEVEELRGRIAVARKAKDAAAVTELAKEMFSKSLKGTYYEASKVEGTDTQYRFIAKQRKAADFNLILRDCQDAPPVLDDAASSLLLIAELTYTGIIDVDDSHRPVRLDPGCPLVGGEVA